MEAGSSSLSAVSDDVNGGDVAERLAGLESRVQAQEDEVALLKAALADVIRRVGGEDDGRKVLGRTGTPLCGRGGLPTLPSLPSRPALSNGCMVQRKSSTTGNLPSTGKKESASNSRRMRRTTSFERLSQRRDPSLGNSRAQGRPPGTKPPDSKPKDPVYNPEEGYVKMYLRGRPITMYVPQEKVEGYRLDIRLEPPSERLKLDWVYGYRGKDCRSNLYLLPTGEMVYFIASVVVLYNTEEGSQRHYLGHTDDIKCLAVHPDRITIATGQVVGTSKDGKPLPAHVRVWDSVSLNTLHLIGSGVFERGVLCVTFSKSNGGGQLCAVDDGNEHILSIWDWQREEKMAHVKCSNEPVFAAEFHPTEPNLVITCGKSHVHFWTMDNGVLSKKQGIFEKHEKPKYILCVTFTESGGAITGDSSGNIYIWGKGTNRISLALCAAHSGGIFALCTRRDGSLLSGGKDHKLIAWDTNFHKTHEAEIPEAFGPVRTIAEGRGEMLLVGTTRNTILQGSMTLAFQPVVQGHTDEMWGLAVHPSQAAFLTCACDRQAIFWDADTHHPLWVHHLEDPALSADFNPSGTVVAIGSHFGRWLVLDVETQDVITAHTDGPEHLSVMRYSPDGTFLAVGSHDNNIYVYAVDENGGKYTRLGKCVGHSSFITHLDWSADGKHLISNSGDYEILYWLATSCKQVTSAASVRSVEWATYTCVLGFHVYGVWSDGSDGTDINALCRSHSQRVLAIADDFGKVQLFPFPCAQPKAPCHIYGGHSSHVTNVGFSHDDGLLFSTGGKDCSILQWRVV
uniref:echinoderm microtubule-associated protein-like 2 isoform X4 n=1 Tax=Myxine glutinosa TaxID=7769 RepID=UPI00358F089D